MTSVHIRDQVQPELNAQRGRPDAANVAAQVGTPRQHPPRAVAVGSQETGLAQEHRTPL